MKELRHYPIMVAIETDATLYHGEHAKRPRLLDRGQTEQLLAHVASDLGRLFPQYTAYSLCMAGALFDQAQILRPGLPLYRALESLVPPPAGEGEYQPNLFSIGASDGAMPVAELQPLTNITPGLLQLLPILVSAPADEASALFDEMEHRFLEEGQVSAHSAKGLEAGFGIAVTHARLMTFTDLQAMLHLQLEHFGFAGLWQLLDAAINGLPEHLDIETRHGARFRWDGHRVLARFETFDAWAAQGVGQTLPADAGSRAEGYSNWTREYRQYLLTLREHAIPVAQYLPGAEEDRLQQSFLVEESALRPREQAAQVTEHSSGELGTIAVSVVDGGRLFNYYPLKPEGLNDLHAQLRAAGLTGGGISFPGTIRLNRAASHLQPDRI